MLAYPSKAANEKLLKDERDRLKAQKERLGKEGLEAKGKAVREAIESQVRSSINHQG